MTTSNITRASDSRSRILERVRKATASIASANLQSSYAGIERDYARLGKLSTAERVALMIERTLAAFGARHRQD